MTMTGISPIDTSVQKVNVWVNELNAELRWDDKHRAFQALRATLHALRDRLIPDEAAHLGTQLPVVLAGFYYEGWKPSTTPRQERTQEEFLAQIGDYFENIEPSINPDRVARAVFKLLSERITRGEIEDVSQMMPSEIAQLWPQAVRK